MASPEIITAKMETVVRITVVFWILKPVKQHNFASGMKLKKSAVQSTAVEMTMAATAVKETATALNWIWMPVLKHKTAYGMM